MEGGTDETKLKKSQSGELVVSSKPKQISINFQENQHDYSLNIKIIEEKWPCYHKARLITRRQYYLSTQIFKAANRHGLHTTYSGKKMSCRILYLNSLCCTINYFFKAEEVKLTGILPGRAESM